MINLFKFFAVKLVVYSKKSTNMLFFNKKPGKLSKRFVNIFQWVQRRVFVRVINCFLGLSKLPISYNFFILIIGLKSYLVISAEIVSSCPNRIFNTWRKLIQYPLKCKCSEKTPQVTQKSAKFNLKHALIWLTSIEVYSSLLIGLTFTTLLSLIGPIMVPRIGMVQLFLWNKALQKFALEWRGRKQDIALCNEKEEKNK